MLQGARGFVSIPSAVGVGSLSFIVAQSVIGSGALGALIDTRILAASGPTETITGTCKQAVEIEAGLKAKWKQPGVGLVPFFYWR
jgi:hypothetical protein